MRNVIIRAGMGMLAMVDTVLVRYSRIGDPARFDTAEFPWSAPLERNWRTIRAEVEQILSDADAVPPLRSISPDHDNIAVDEKWQSFFLWGYGLRVDANCERCPRTTELVEAIPGMQTALFSILAPGTHIPLHNGVTKAILTGHLALVVPPDRSRCHMSIDGADYSWTEGELLLFDDMRMHEVWNDTDERRVVLMMHITRPQRFPGSIVNAAMIALIRNSPFVRDVQKQIEQWRTREPTDQSAPPIAS